MLGNYIKSYLTKNNYNIVLLERKDYDLSNLSIESLRYLLLNKGLEEDDIVINCAGVIPQSSKQREIDTRLYFTINSLFPVILSMICSHHNAKMIHITTDCVFSGKEGNYDEKSIHNETNSYGISKSLGELSECCIIRTSIIGEEINNKRSLLEWVISNKGKEINGFVDHKWNGVTCLELAKIIHKIIKNKKYWIGTRHIFSPSSVSKYELISMINDIYELKITVNKLNTEIIDKTITTNYKLFTIPDLRDQIIEMKNYKS